MTIGERITGAVRGLPPGYFAAVMATGIVSIGLQMEGFRLASLALLVLGVIEFVVLVVLTAWRLLRYREAVRADFTDPGRAFAFFTFIAGANVLGTRFEIEGARTVTAGLLVVAGVAWVALGYLVPWTSVLDSDERPVYRHANGTWFIWVVASQSVAVAAASIEPYFEVVHDELAVLAITSWSIGAILYGAVGILVAIRLTRYRVTPQDLIAPYWVAMGACAITVVAGARITEMTETPMVHVTRGLIGGLSVTFWAFATWLIPVLVAAGWWKHIKHRVPMSYDAGQWSIIFPLGMYAVAGIFLGGALKLPIVSFIGATELWVAVAAWLITLAAMARRLLRTLRRSSGVTR